MRMMQLSPAIIVMREREEIKMTCALPLNECFSIAMSWSRPLRDGTPDARHISQLTRRTPGAPALHALDSILKNDCRKLNHRV